MAEFDRRQRIDGFLLKQDEVWWKEEGDLRVQNSARVTKYYIVKDIMHLYCMT